MRDGWVEGKLGDFVRVTSGFAFSTKSWREHGIPVIKINNVRNGQVSIENCSFIQEPVPEGASRFLLKKGDLLITLTGEIGAIGFVTQSEPMYLNQRVGRLDLLARDRVSLKFIGLFLSLPEVRAEMWSHGKGNAQLNISPTSIQSLTINLPPLPEQRRIVDLISSVDSYIEALRQELASAQSIRSSISESLWSSFSLRSKLSSFGETLTGSTPPTKKLQYWESHDVDFFTPSDLGANLKLDTASRGVSHQGAAISRPLKAFSVLQVCIGATIGKVGYLNQPAVMNQQINALTNLDEHDAPMLAAILSSETFQSIIRNSAGGSTLPIISKSSWGEIEIPHVPENERIMVSQVISELGSFINQSKLSLISAEKLRRSILHNLLNGTHKIPESYDRGIGAA